MTGIGQTAWYGRVVEVVDNVDDSRVAIDDVQSQEVVWFPFRPNVGLAPVFRSMSSLGQPLQVMIGLTGEYRFSSAIYSRIESITRDSQAWVIKPEGNSVGELHLSDSCEDSKSIVEQLFPACDSGQACWFITRENHDNKAELHGSRTRSPKHNLVNIVASTWTTPICNLLTPYAHEFLEPQHRPITVPYAKQLFNELQRQSTHPVSGPLTGIPFLYVQEGCDERSHLMANYLISKGVFPFKIWVHVVEGTLRMVTPNHPDCEVQWSYHNAPIVWTESGFMAIDPSVCDDAVPVEDWYSKFSTPNQRKVYAASHHVYYFPRSGCRIRSDPQLQETNLSTARLINSLRLQSQLHGFPPCRTTP